jgi:hypothetical protein
MVEEKCVARETTLVGIQNPRKGKRKTVGYALAAIRV